MGRKPTVFVRIHTIAPPCLLAYDVATQKGTASTMPSSTVENYLKQLYASQQRTKRKLVTMGTLARAMEVTPGTATAMIKTLAESGLVEYQPRSGVRLTKSGEQLALHVLRRHRLIELFLVEVLGLDWSEVHKEADELEHAVSDHVLERIDALLGHPQVDPHGDPIPTAKGAIQSNEAVALAACEPGARFTIDRTLDQDPAFLRFLDEQGLRPGVACRLLSQDNQADALQLQVGSASGGGRVTLGGSAAQKLMVRIQGVSG